MISLHSHSGEFCRHAKDSLEDVVLEAIRQGFTTYGLSEHCPRHDLRDLYPEEAGLTLGDLNKTFQAYVTRAKLLKRKYASRVQLLIGLETEWIRPERDAAELRALVVKHRRLIDYIVGSVHHVRTIPIDFDQTMFDHAVGTCGSLRQCQLEYFDAQNEMLQSLKPEVIGHFDLIRLFTPESRLDEDEKVWQAVQRNVEYAIGYGALFEVNSAALRKGWKTPYPGEEVLALLRANGARLCLSDDSHGVARVGLNYAETKAYLERMGVKELYTLASRGPGQRAEVQQVTNWADHSFWSN